MQRTVAPGGTSALVAGWEIRVVSRGSKMLWARWSKYLIAVPKTAGANGFVMCPMVNRLSFVLTRTTLTGEPVDTRVGTNRFPDKELRGENHVFV